MIPASGGMPVQITGSGGLRPKASPDGQFIYFTKGYRHSGYRLRGFARPALVLYAQVDQTASDLAYTKLGR